MSRVALIEPRSTFNGYQHFKLPLLGLVYLGTVLKKKGHQVTVHCENIRSIYNHKRKQLDPSLLKNDVIGISTMTSTAPRGYAIAEAIRRANSKIKILFGGPHASLLPEEPLRYGDAVVSGEAETKISDLVDDFDLRGVIEGERIHDLDSLPYPDLSVIEGIETGLNFAPISTSRGCPYGCTFCSVSTLFGRKYRFRSPENVIDEIDLRLKSGHRKVFFYDDNFAASKERTKTLLDQVLTRKLDFWWSAQSRVDVGQDNELLKLMAKSRCGYILVGMESINPKTLENYNKRQSLEDIKQCIKRLQQHEIKVHGMFIIGADEDSPNTIRETVKFCHQTKLDSAQFSILFPIPGTPLYRQLDTEQRIFTKDWSLYDGTHVVFRPMNMRPAELQRMFVWAWKRFYSLANVKRFLVSRYLLNKWQRINSRFLNYIKQIGELK